MTKYFAFILECIYLTVYQKRKTCLRAGCQKRAGKKKKKKDAGHNREGGFAFWMGKGKQERSEFYFPCSKCRFLNRLMQTIFPALEYRKRIFRNPDQDKPEMNLGSFMPTNPSEWSLGTLLARILRVHPDLGREFAGYSPERAFVTSSYICLYT